ncbi:MAG: pyridoxamine 5'-phosphate oxidase family protein [Candidatus Micrarchaeota archaeon]|nr:pyridoxamine 5'-phosphate oxidase family protein [Candidatus Micrarchaeota archaeon]
MRFSQKEIAFLKSQDELRVATVSKKGWPQVTTVVHVFDGKTLYFATDYGTRKYKNLLCSNKISVLVDIYARQPKAITIQGRATLLEKGKEFVRAYKLLEKRHSYYRANPFKQGEAPIVKVIPLRKNSSGIN